ncbi:WASH complex subunit 2A isoform X3 [Mobula hypostoma]|uniref:WASH complex subunit 2A isoform X3 n=1 Tax=Mobula hypostoma TaxID=723540 RepID=UPI002FC2D2FF
MLLEIKAAGIIAPDCRGPGLQQQQHPGSQTGRCVNTLSRAPAAAQIETNTHHFRGGAGPEEDTPPSRDHVTVTCSIRCGGVEERSLRMNGASVTVNGAPGENSCETEPIWERPWTLEEIHKASGNWSLGADAGLLLFLQDFSQRMLSRTHEIEKQLDDLIQHTKATDSRLHNVFNDFLMLSNIQFIENRVYDEDVEETVKPDSGDKPAEVEKTREQKEAELIAKVQEAVRHGLKVLDSAFEQLDIKAGNSDSEDEETTERVEHLLEPKDLYVDRPLPYIIGSSQFMKEDDVGLGDLSSEESVDSERGSIVESEEEREKEEESEDDFESEEDEEKLPKSVPKQQLVSDEDEDDDSDLFHESEKESNEEVLTSSKKMGHFSFAEELAARIQEGNPEKPDEERASLTSHGSATKSKVKTKKETGKAKQQEESNLFGSENADEDDNYSQFCSRGGLFSGGKGLFDDDEGDLFTEAPKEKIDEESEVKPSDEGGDIFKSDAIPEKIHGKGAKKKVTKPPPAQSAGGLFDEEDDDLFGSKTSSSVAPEPKPATILFDDSDDSGLFETSVTPKVPKEKSRVQQNAGPLTEVLESSTLLGEKSQTSSGLFSDEDESKDLVFPSKNTRKNESKQSSGSKTKSSQLPISLFDDDDEEGDLFSAISSRDSSASKKSQQQNESKVAPSNLKSAVLFDSDEGDWQGSNSPVTERVVDIAGTQTSLTKAVTPKAAAASKAVKTSLFDDPEEEDLFGVSGKESKKKPQKVSLLFEDDDEDDLFASKPAASKPADQPAAAPQSSTVFSKAVENDSVESDGKSQMEQKVETKKRPPGAVPLFAGVDVLQQQEKTKLLTSSGITSQGADTTSKSSSPSSQEELQSSRKAVVSLFDDKDDEDLEDTASQHDLVHDEKLPESGTSTRVFQDEELLFSHHQQKDNDPDVDLFADAQKPEVKKSQMKPPTNPPVSPQTKAAELPSHDLFDTTDSLFNSSKPSSAKTPSKSNIFEDKEDEDLFGAVSKKPPVVHTKHTNMGPIKTKGPSSRIGKLQANLAINTASLLPGASPKFQGIAPGSASISSPPTLSKNIATAPESPVGEGSSVNLNQPVQVDVLHSVNKNRARVTRKRRPPTREARRLAAQQSAEVEEVDQRSEVDGASVKKRVSAPGLSVKQSPDKTLSAVLTSPIERSPDKNDDPLSAATVDLDSDLFSSGDSFKSSLVQAPAAATEIRKDTVPSKEPIQSMFAPSEDDLFRSSKQTMKKPKPAFLEEEDENLFGTAKLETTKPSTKTSKSIDIFEDDLFATESVTLTKKKNEGNTDVNLFDDNVDIFADIKIAPKEKKSRKKIETKSIFDDDMDDIFASASSSASSKKQFKPKSKANQTAIPNSTAEGKTANIFDDPLNVFGP